MTCEATKVSILVPQRLKPGFLPGLLSLGWDNSVLWVESSQIKLGGVL